MFLKILFLFVWISGQSPYARARLAGVEDAPYAFNERTMEYEIHSDGTYEYFYSEVVEVLKEGRKQEIGTRRIPYNSRTSRLTVLKAEVVNGARRQSVD